MKIAMPTTNMRRRPSRSPARAPRSSRPPKVERVRVLHPREPRRREAERVLDVGQRGDDDRDVEDDHQVAGEDDREHGGRFGLVGVRDGHADGTCLTSLGVGRMRGAKVEGASRTSGGSLRLIYGGCLRLSRESGAEPHANPKPTPGSQRPQRADARRNTRSARRGARGVRRGRHRRRRSRTSLSAPASASARSTATSRSATHCSRPSTSTRSRRSARSADDLADVPPWEALSRWLHRYVGFAATKRALAEELLETRPTRTRSSRAGRDRRPRARARRAARRRRAPSGPTRTSWTSPGSSAASRSRPAPTRADGADAPARARRAPPAALVSPAEVREPPVPGRSLRPRRPRGGASASPRGGTSVLRGGDSVPHGRG